MAISANTAWEIRPLTGNDLNGGGFVAGASGTDWSQQANPQYSVADGVTAGTTTITSASANFGTDVVGNIMYVQGGTGAIVAGWYQITARTNATTITVDRNTGLSTGTGVALRIGGSLQTINAVTSIYTASNKMFVKAEAPITITAAQTFATGVAPSAAAPYSRLISYTSSRTDGGQTLITLSTNTGIKGLRATGNGISFENFNVNCSSLGTSTGVALDGNTNRVKNCKVSNATTAGISSGVGNSIIFGCEVTGCTSTATAGISTTVANDVISFNNVHDNACPGISATGGFMQMNCNLVTNNTGASSDGIIIASQPICTGNTVYGSGRHGINITSSTRALVGIIRNNIFAGNGGFGFDPTASAGWSADSLWDGNAYWNNTSGNRNNADDTTTNPINGVGPYANILDVICTVNPFNNSAGGDFTLNNISGGGAAIRGHGTPGTMPGITQVGYIDIGVFQHSNPSINRGILTGGNM
jgi:hypothetical protein